MCNLLRFYFPECKPMDLDYRHVPHSFDIKLFSGMAAFGYRYPLEYLRLLRENSDALGRGLPEPLVPSPAKYIYVNREAPQLYDISKDPGEWNNSAGRPEYAEIERELREYILNRFDPDEIERRVLASQRRRLFIRDAMKHGKRNSWDYQPFVDETKRFKR